MDYAVKSVTFLTSGHGHRITPNDCFTAESFKFRASNASTVGTDFSCSKSGSKSFASTVGGSHTINTIGPIVTICGKLVVHAKPA